MADTLKNRYAVDMQHWYNRRVTEAWDKAQERVSDVMTRRAGGRGGQHSLAC